MAYSRGWKALAFLPLAICFAIGVLMGASGMSIEEAGPLVFIPDVIATVVLGVMCVVPPLTQVQAVEEPEREVAVH